jgi:hypothetical protein
MITILMQKWEVDSSGKEIDYYLRTKVGDR